MPSLIFATNNEHKLKEIQNLIHGGYKIIGLRELGLDEDIPETAESLEGNALLKARYIRDRYKLDCFADDTGLEVDALGGSPGVHSARYAGEDGDSGKNIDKLLDELKGKEDRNAQFRTVIALLLGDDEILFTGKVRGRILEKRRGNDGFGYDPVFLPEGCEQTFAEMPLKEKNQISHRARAMKKLVKFLEA
ncbi:MAG: non-canonical purine NTP diphosphatase [Bacteroidales bacterium]